MRDALDEQIEAFEALRPDIVRRHGAVWALVSNRALVSTFAEFSEAARYASERLATQQVLIRHTDQHTETAPFIHIEG